MAVRGLLHRRPRTTCRSSTCCSSCAAHGSINTLFSIEGGAQENLVDGGAGSIAQRIADDLGDAVHLNAPVRSITQHDDHVDGRDRRRSRSRPATPSSTVPPALALEITSIPRSPTTASRSTATTSPGPESKTLVVYDEPFWRADGFSGQTSQPGSAAEVTLDASPSSGTPGVHRVVHVRPGRRARATRSTRPSAGARCSTRSRPGSGRAPRRPVEFVETAWWSEEWTRGCSMAHFRPGSSRATGTLLREPFGRVHWAGTETSTTSHGAIDGAVRSGERAAAEILARE